MLKLSRTLRRFFPHQGQSADTDPGTLADTRRPISQLCTQAQLLSPEFLGWIRQFQDWSFDEKGELQYLHRKLWEWGYICQTLKDTGMLQPGKRGLVFAVGREPLPACFASFGCEIVATDLPEEQAQETGWLNSKQHSLQLETLYKPHLCDEKSFYERVSFRAVNMNEIPDDLTGFDFVWSACAFEHLGSIELGKQFIYRMMDCLKPGGVAVHTTEYNLSSNEDTVDNTGTVLYRQRDIEEMADHLRRAGHFIQVDYTSGDQPADLHVDVPPYAVTPHLKLQLMEYVLTSIGLAIVKNPQRSLR